MGPKKRPNATPTLTPTSTASQMKFRPVLETNRLSAKGTKPLPSPVTLPEIFTKVLVHGCKRIMFLNPIYRIIGYAVLLFFISLVSDYLPFPRTYFSNTQNVLNQYFVKLSWGWTIVLLGIFTNLTSSVYCCGKWPLMSRHFCRLVIASIIWFTWTSVFQVVEETTGQCLYTGSANAPSTVLYSKGRRHCVKGGGKWTSLDISGHSFILIWCTLFIIEESRAILGWDTIADFIRNEEHRRTIVGERRASDLTNQVEETPVSHLTPEEFEILKKNYKRFGVWAKVMFMALTGLTLLWDIMLIATACYFHIMMEKVVAGLIAMLMWAFTYRGLYTWDVSVSPGLPGVGLFRYSPGTAISTAFESKANSKPEGINVSRPGQTLSDEVPHFMGMPLYPQRGKSKGKDLIGGGPIISMEGVSGLNS